MESSPGCWQVYGEVLAREYARSALRPAHRLAVDSYAVQHPGRRSDQATLSVCVHLLRLCLVVERGADVDDAARAARAALRRKERFVWLTPPRSLGRVTVADVAAASTRFEHQRRVLAWADSAWSAWTEHHAVVRGWLSGAG